jgi:NitT/TauT family transport system substrate-binding protein
MDIYQIVDMRIRPCAARIFFLLLLPLMAGCGPSTLQTPLKIAINPWPGYEFMFLAQAQGYFEAEGVNVKLVEYSSLSDVRRAFEHGDVDGMAVTLIEVLQSRHNSNRRPQPVLVPDYSSGADVIIARGGFQGVTELRGKRVGAEIASLNLFILARALEREGLTLQDVELFPMDQMDMESAFAEGRIDAAVSYPPFSFELMKYPGARPIFTTAEIPGEVVDVIAMDQTVIDRRREDIQALIRGWGRAIEYARRHPRESIEYLAKREQITPEEFRQALQGIHLVSPDEQNTYFGPGGKLEQSLRRVDQNLRGIGALEGPDRTAGVVPGHFIVPANDTQVADTRRGWDNP